MSRIDDERLGLGWNAWFLLTVLGIGGILGPLIPNIIGVGLELAETNSVPTEAVTLEWRQVVAGAMATAVFATLAIRIFRTTDWQKS